ncbi:MAG: hypothetical protein A3C93_00315 [Candidatus Lloydbacteria bacterium RIFCSPHIGHO2_02_FULL_54_17]|uniref:Uncharacterized protein n=1 Tax=Candidatus Lloydbacteria bacterium RIFCSPHIGHO2_02_FULL_54_17 TaxID=1798664 RepID=A0A1G2DEG4_9BACT|nr:MAG: hypothetical protein A2762_01985 [Candidatus Lloydbacteria bacterium RIFCSPHIGHO2_01_FULL_54_11]OGZ11832.1 MAG: hypothetical protein A3C93_00315 [Candidatus Lloydbacteria bacterium RIFCSPHIGHO2_02_FULL_54_17]OGZ14146.1 MAG: hypothetical protein A2948_03470 [Candidatus Lloydbacteria bacterium RIFCSPLOWO2_01_FULL_54_18]OGZ16678.1 MAG: hypothetical protein A3H76_00020 [Candidatus Lloydbacteria bacterium RIFCSPLOWO2_02_FULL_54_12]
MDFFSNLNLGCAVNKVLTTEGMLFDIFVLLATAIFFFVFKRKVKYPLAHFGIILSGVLIFEMFTSPMWDNPHLGAFAYFYKDVSWILSLGWSVMMLSALWIADLIAPKAKELARFGVGLVVMTIAGIIAESVVLALGLRAYAPEVHAALSGIMVANVPLEALYYIPVFSVLIMGFYKYWSFILDGRPAVPIKKGRFVRNFLIVALSVFFFELMIEPMVENRLLPEWSYIYRDISILLTGFWVLLVFVAEALVERFFAAHSLPDRFVMTLLAIAVVATPIEGWLIGHGFRVYGESATRDFVGISMPFSGVPIEVVFAIPLYFALILGLSKFVQLCLDNKR